MSPVLGIIASSNQQGRGGDASAFYSIASIVVPSGGLSSVTFAGIPSIYRHLQLVAMTKTTVAGSDTWATSLTVYPNGDTTNTNYSRSYVYGNGFGTTVGDSGNNSVLFGPIMSSGYANSFSIAVVDFLDYANTTKTKPIRTLAGSDASDTYSWVGATTNQWKSLNAVTSLLVALGSGSFAQNTTLSLYGVL